MRRAALLLIDLQHHFLELPGLRPPRPTLLAGVAALLSAFRKRGLPVVHVRTTVHSIDEALPHWRTLPELPCLAGSPGHGVPAEFEPWPGELVIHKRGFNAFQSGELDAHLQGLGVHRLVLAGVQLRTCVLTAAMEAHQRGFEVVLASGAVGDDDPLHAEVCRRWLEKRGIAFLEQAALDALPYAACSGNATSAAFSNPQVTAHASPLNPNAILWEVAHTLPEQIGETVHDAQASAAIWGVTSALLRREVATRFREGLHDQASSFAAQITHETGKPIQAARSELRFALQHLDDSLKRPLASGWAEHGQGWQCRRRPHGVVAAITPWNNPVAIPIGKLIPALLHGNTVVWKPALPGTALARRCLQLLEASGLPPGCLGLIEGGPLQAVQLMEHPAVDAITITGGSQAGMAAQVVAARRRLPLQAELGGNNAALVWRDADLVKAAAAIAEGAFGCAGQRCTANRRVIVAAELLEPFRLHLLAAIEALPWGDPQDGQTVVGPVMSAAAAERLHGLVERARRAGCRIHQRSDPLGWREHAPCYVPPTLIEATDPDAEWVQEESFGPILVLQVAATWEQAMALCNGVRQALVAALFSHSSAQQSLFLEQAHAGILKLNASTAGVCATAPFGGWGESGIGLPEHGFSDLDFYSRIQIIYPG